jgi:hypothetical protein
VIGDEARGAELIAPLRALGAVIDTFASVPPAAIAELHMDPQEPVPGIVDSQLLGGLDAAAVDAFVAAAGPGSGSQLIVADIRHVGGALRRPAAGQGALGTLDAEYATLAVGMAADPVSREASQGRFAALRRAFEAHDTGALYANFAERSVDPARFFAPGAYQRLRVVRGAIDPGGLMRANHPIPPA